VEQTGAVASGFIEFFFFRWVLPNRRQSELLIFFLLFFAVQGDTVLQKMYFVCRTKHIGGLREPTRNKHLKSENRKCMSLKIFFPFTTVSFKNLPEQ
jgi:hypothetical protein